MTPSLDISYDADTDIATIEGVQWRGELLRAICRDMPIGKWFRIVSRESSGIVTVGTVNDELQQKFNALCGEA